MNRTLTTVVQVFTLLIVASPVWAGQAPVVPIEDCLEVRLSSVQSNRNGLPANVQVSPASLANGIAGTMTIMLDVEIRDPNRIIATSTLATITELRDAQGRRVSPGPGGSPRVQRYAGPRYRTRLVTPPPLSKWQQIVHWLLRRPSNANTGPQRVSELVPSRLAVQIEEAPLQKAGREIQRMEGHFYALTPGSVEYVDIPFEPSNKWVRLTPDIEVRVLRANSTASTYDFEIEANYPNGRTPVTLTAEEPLPSRLVVARHFLSDTGKPTQPPRAFRTLPAPIAGRGSGSGTQAQVKTIRYVIAVNPKHSRIPFTLEHIPLP